jgi:hypothetical protein
LKDRPLSRLGAAAAALVLSLASLGAPAYGCACCSNRGQRNVETQKIDAYATGILDEVRFAEGALLYPGEGDPEVAGLTTTSTEFRVTATKTDAAWVLGFAGGGSGGKLTFKLPQSFARFEVDPREPDRGDESGRGPVLYKEWRLTFTPQGSGMFKGVTGGDQRATLILHGRGNSCTDASQFNAWTLVLHGPKGTSTLFGTLLQ